MGVVKERAKTLFDEPMRHFLFDPHPTLRLREGPPSPQEGEGKGHATFPQVMFKHLPCL